MNVNGEKKTKPSNRRTKPRMGAHSRECTSLRCRKGMRCEEAIKDTEHGKGKRERVWRINRG